MISLVISNCSRYDGATSYRSHYIQQIVQVSSTTLPYIYLPNAPTIPDAFYNFVLIQAKPPLPAATTAPPTCVAIFTATKPAPPAPALCTVANKLPAATLPMLLCMVAARVPMRCPQELS